MLGATRQEAGVCHTWARVSPPSKEALFEGLFREMGASLQQSFDLDKDADIKEVLHAFGTTYAAALSQPESLAIHRLLVAEGPRFPFLRDIAIATAQECSLAQLQEYLRAKDQDGALRVPDVERAAAQFLCLLRGSWHVRATIGETPSSADISATVSDAVNMFTAAYGASYYTQ